MKYLLLLLLPLIIVSCQRGITDISTNTPGDVINCDLLNQGLEDTSVTIIGESLEALLNKEYSNENLQQLATSISANCDIAAELKCFDCIKTNPPQSELSLSFVAGGDSLHYMLNLAPADNNTIEIVSVN